MKGTTFRAIAAAALFAFMMTLAATPARAQSSTKLAAQPADRKEQPTARSASLIGTVRDLGGDLIEFQPAGSDVWLRVPVRMIRGRHQVTVGPAATASSSAAQVRLQLVGDESDFAKVFGVWGWNEIRDYVTLVGVVEENAYSAADGDWLLKVRPDSDYAFLLNNTSGKRNHDGMIECEVEPPDAVGNEANAYRYFGRLKGKRVVIVGTFAEDKSHDDKTEIHPITTIAAVDGDQFEFFSISDDSMNFFATVPHSGENRTAHVSLPVPERFTTFAVAEEIDLAASKAVGIVREGTSHHFVATVQTGIADEGKGFYYLRGQLQQCPPHGCSQPVPPRGAYLAVRFYDGTGEAGGEMLLQKNNDEWRTAKLRPNMTARELAKTAAGLAVELRMPYMIQRETIKLYAEAPWPRFQCDPGVFDYWEGID